MTDPAETTASPPTLRTIPAADRELAGTVAEDLIGAFVWGDTRQGHAYWNAVYTSLRDLAEGKDA